MKTQIHILPNINFTFIIKNVDMLVNREFQSRVPYYYQESAALNQI